MSRNQPLFPEFLHGASVYPEFMPREEWLRLLDDMLGAGMNTVRLFESAWGFLEPAPGQWRHAEAMPWLDDAHERGLRCILGTGSYLPPQWLFALHPDALVITRDGERAHPLARKSACLEHPDYREAVRVHTESCARAWAGHPSVIAWQIDNEIDRVNLDWTCHCPRCEAAWTEWLRRRYRSVGELNRLLRLDHWGLELPAIESLPLPRVITELGRHPGLVVLEARFRRDRVTAFLSDQSETLRASGATQPCGHNFFVTPDFTAEEPGAAPLLDFGAYNLYLDWESVEDTAAQLRKVRLMEQQRACHDGDFLLMETSIGAVGGQAMVAPAASEATFRRRLMLALSTGARGILYWTGTIWRGGPWIFHGALHDYTGRSVPEMPRIAAFGEFLRRHGPTLLAAPVRRDVAVIGSHAGNALATAYPVYPGSDQAGRRFEAVCRARGLAVDVITPGQASDAAVLARYRVVAIFGDAQGLVAPEMVTALVGHAEAGGTVVVGPLAGYLSEEGVVSEGGLADALRPLTGMTVPIFRWFGDGCVRVVGAGGEFPVLHGMFEVTTDLPRETQVVARLVSEDLTWNGRPALLRRPLGAGVVWKYLATPDAGADSAAWAGVPERHPLLADCLPPDVLGVPREDGSLMLVNLSGELQHVALARASADRFGHELANLKPELPPQAAMWLE